MEATSNLKFELPKVFEKYYREKISGQEFNKEELDELICVVAGVLGGLVYTAGKNLQHRKIIVDYLAKLLHEKIEAVHKEQEAEKKHKKTPSQLPVRAPDMQ